MPFVLIAFGIVLFVAAVQNQQATLWGLVKGDLFGGKDSFAVWIAAIALIGGLGYIKPLKTLSVSLMTLLLLVLVISNKGVFAQLQSFIQSGSSPGATSTTTLQPIAPISPAQQINENLGSVAP